MKLKSIFKKCATAVCALMIGSSLALTVNAASYSCTKSKMFYTNAGSAELRCTATHYTTGNTRWAKAWNAGNYGNGTMSASVGNITMPYITNTYFETTATITIVGYDYSSNSRSMSVGFTWNGSSVTGVIN